MGRLKEKEGVRQDGCCHACSSVSQWYSSTTAFPQHAFTFLSVHFVSLSQEMLSAILSVIELGISGSTSETQGEDGARQVVFKGSESSHAIIRHICSPHAHVVLIACLSCPHRMAVMSSLHACHVLIAWLSCPHRMPVMSSSHACHVLIACLSCPHRMPVMFSPYAHNDLIACLSRMLPSHKLFLLSTFTLHSS